MVMNRIKPKEKVIETLTATFQRTIHYKDPNSNYKAAHALFEDEQGVIRIASMYPDDLPELKQGQKYTLESLQFYDNNNKPYTPGRQGIDWETLEKADYQHGHRIISLLL